MAGRSQVSHILRGLLRNFRVAWDDPPQPGRAGADRESLRNFESRWTIGSADLASSVGTVSIPSLGKPRSGGLLAEHLAGSVAPQRMPPLC